MLVVFNTGNLGARPARRRQLALGAGQRQEHAAGRRHARPAAATTTRCADFTLFGPTRDGRIKPDLVAPACVTGRRHRRRRSPRARATSAQPGTSWSSPTVAGAAALVRQYYTDGFYPSGTAAAANAIHSQRRAAEGHADRRRARRAAGAADIVTHDRLPALPVPSYEQGWGFPVLDDALYFAGRRPQAAASSMSRSRGARGRGVEDDSRASEGRDAAESRAGLDRSGRRTSRLCPTSTPQLVNDLDLRVTTCGRGTKLGNGNTPDRMQQRRGRHARSFGIRHGLRSPSRRTHLGFGARQSFALVITGDYSRRASHTRRRAPFATDSLSCAAMLSREYLREHTDDYRRALENRGATVDLERFVALDADRRRTIAQVEALKAQKNAASQEIATLKKNKQDASGADRGHEARRRRDQGARRPPGADRGRAESARALLPQRPARIRSHRPRRVGQSRGAASGATKPSFDFHAEGALGPRRSSWASSTSIVPQRSPARVSRSSSAPRRSSAARS